MKKVWVGLILLGAVFYFAVVLPFTSPLTVLDWSRPKVEIEFDQTKWLVSKPNDGIRYPMANFLIRKGKLKDLTVDEVQSMLGSPTRDAMIDGEAVLSYLLDGQDMFPAKSKIFVGFSHLNIDSWKLVLHLKNGRVIKSEIRKS